MKVTQQTETNAVIASGITVEDHVVTTGFANLSDGAKVAISKDYQAPTPDLAPRRQSKAAKKASAEKRASGAARRNRAASPQGGQQQPGGGAKAPQ